MSRISTTHQYICLRSKLFHVIDAARLANSAILNRVEGQGISALDGCNGILFSGNDYIDNLIVFIGSISTLERVMNLYRCSTGSHGVQNQSPADAGLATVFIQFA